MIKAKRNFRILPKISYHNYKQKDTFKNWLWVHRKWGGRLVYIHVKSHQLCFDFRKDFIADASSNQRGE